MRAGLLHTRLRLPWWLFLLTRPGDLLRLDFRLARWGRVAPSEPAPAVFAADLQHVCYPQCRCLVTTRGEVVMAARMLG